MAEFTSNEALVRDLGMQRHPEGGFFVETDRQTVQIPSPFAGGQPRPLATSIFYLLTHEEPRGVFHMNKSVTMHVLHHGRAEYTLIHPESPPRVECVVMGPDARAGERRQLLVGTGVWKMSRLPEADVRGATTAEQRAHTGCLITEVVTPGFVWEDHAFLTREELERVFEGAEGGAEWVRELEGFVKKG